MSARDDADQTGRMRRLIRAFAGRIGRFIGFVMLQLILYCDFACTYFQHCAHDAKSIPSWHDFVFPPNLGDYLSVVSPDPPVQSVVHQICNLTSPGVACLNPAPVTSCIEIGHEMSCLMTKPTKWHVRPVKTQISLGIRPV